MPEWDTSSRIIKIIRANKDFPFSIWMEINSDISGDYDIYDYKVEISNNYFDLSISGTKRKIEDAKKEAELKSEIIKDCFLDILKKSLGEEEFSKTIELERKTFNMGRPYQVYFSTNENDENYID